MLRSDLKLQNLQTRRERYQLITNGAIQADDGLIQPTAKRAESPNDVRNVRNVLKNADLLIAKSVELASSDSIALTKHSDISKPRSAS